MAKSVWRAVLMLSLIGSVLPSLARAQASILYHVSNNAGLQALASTAYPVVVRDGYAGAGDAPPLEYTSSATACPINSGNGDNGYQVKSSDSKCWIASFPSLGADVREWGAKCDGASDDSAAITAAEGAMATTTPGIVSLPLKTCFTSSAIVNRPNVSIRGVAAYSGSVPTGSILACSNSVTTACLILSGDGASSGLGNGTQSVENLIVEFSGAPNANAAAVEVLGGYNINLTNVMAYNAGNGFAFVGTCTTPPSTGCVFGISARAIYLSTGKILTNHIYINNWPELRVELSRFGSAGAGDVNSNAYIYVTGGAGGGGQGPNGIFFDDDQFNQGSNAPAYWLQFANISGAGFNVAEWRFTDDHIEGVGVANIKSDSTTSQIDRMSIKGTQFNTPGVPFLALDAATQPSEWEIVGNEIYCHDFSINSTTAPNAVEIANNRIGCASSIAATGSGGTVEMTANSYAGSLTFGGSGNWGSISAIGGHFTSGAFTNSTTTASRVQWTFANAQDQSCSAALQFGGASTGITYTANACTYQIVGDRVTGRIHMVLNSTGTATGAATITGLPKIVANAYEVMPITANALPSVSGGVTALSQGGNGSLSLYQSSGGSLSALTKTNFAASSELEINFSYTY